MNRIIKVQYYFTTTKKLHSASIYLLLILQYVYKISNSNGRDVENIEKLELCVVAKH